MSKMIRLDEQSNKTLDDLVKETGSSKQALVRKAISQLMRDYFLQKSNLEYERLQQDPIAWKEELGERAEWDVTLLDGLEDED